MKRLFWGILAVLVGLWLSDVYEKGKESQSQSASRETKSVKDTNGVEFFVIGSNADEVARYYAKKQAAQEYLGKVIFNVSDMLAMKKLPEGASLPAKTREMNALADAGEIFGQFVGENASFLHQCRSAGLAARQLWNAIAGSTNEAPVTALEIYNDHVRECISQIKTPPQPTLILLGPPEQVKPPFEGCLSIFDSKVSGKWSCSSSSIGM